MTERVSVTADGQQARGTTAPWPAVSGDGRFVVFVFAGRLVPDDTNGEPDVYVRNRQTGSVELISRPAGGGVADRGSWQELDISDDGRFVAFASRATNLVAGDTNERRDVFVRDRLNDVTRLASTAGATPANGISTEPALSADGRVVAFTSRASNLVPNDTNHRADIFVWNRLDGSTRRV